MKPVGPGLLWPVELEVSTGLVQAQALAVHVDHIEVIAPGTLSLGAELTVRMRRDGEAPAVELRGRVSELRNGDGDGDGDGDGEIVACITFDALSAHVRAQVADLELWDAIEEGAEYVVLLRGRFDERTDFSPLDFEGRDQVVFDLSRLRSINSWGARSWIMFLRALPQELSYSFRAGSLEFVKHCNMIADMLGRGFLTSFYAPFVCEACNEEAERLLVTRELKSNILRRPPVFSCDCGGQEVLDDVPSRYFAFLSLAGRTTR